MEIEIQQAIKAHKEGRIEEAERLYRSISKNQPTNLAAYNNLGVILQNLGRLDEAEINYRKVIELKPDYGEAHYNLGITLQGLHKFGEAETSYRKAIELKPDYGEAHYNLGITLQGLHKFGEAETSYRKAIELKPDYANVYFNLGNTLRKINKLSEAEKNYRKAIELKPNYAESYLNLGAALKVLGKFDEAEISYRKAIEIKPDYVEAHHNLEVLLKQKRLLSKIEQAKKSEINTKISLFKKNFSKLFKSDIRLNSNPVVLSRKVEAELISQLYKINTRKLNDVNPNIAPCYGNGRNSDYNLFKNNFSTIKIVTKDLINIMKEAVKSDIFIMESFFNIFQAGGGIISHNHINNFDNNYELLNKKFSLSYYLDVGDQNCSEPGTLKLQDPDKEILPTDGMIVIFPASRKHSAAYGGEKDRVMIGVNFYSLI